MFLRPLPTAVFRVEVRSDADQSNACDGWNVCVPTTKVWMGCVMCDGFLMDEMGDGWMCILVA